MDCLPWPGGDLVTVTRRSLTTLPIEELGMRGVLSLSAVYSLALVKEL